MNRGLVIADSGAIFSLAIVQKLDLLNKLFDSVRIPFAVWQEITLNKTNEIYPDIKSFFENKVEKISSFNELTFVMDYGESESVILYKELDAQYLLIDDKKARELAENFGLNCIGTLGLLILAKKEKHIHELKPIFEEFIARNRYYSKKLLNSILKTMKEEELE